MKIQNVLNCSFSSWYEKFKKVTIRSKVVDLPHDFIEYLLADGLVLPESLQFSRQQSSDDSDDEVDWNNPDLPVAETPVFPDLTRRVEDSIEELGGHVFPKLNWSSPRDASWIALNNSTLCRNFCDICLLLKSSDFIANDLTDPFKFCDDRLERSGLTYSSDPIVACQGFQYQLVLRKWIEIDPSMEFRCFVKNDKLIGISQRDYTNYYSYIGYQRNDIVQDIQSFFKEHMQGKFVDKNYVFDVYRRRKDRVRLMDFNPFGPITDPLLFRWEDLAQRVTSTAEEVPEFQYIHGSQGFQPSPFRQYALPRDVVDLSTGEDPCKLVDLLQGNLKIQSQNDSSSEDDEDVNSVNTP